MPLGTLLPLPRPIQDEPKNPLRLDRSYYMLSLEMMQAYFELGWLAQPAALVVSSEVKTSFSEQTFTSLHQVATVKKGEICYLPLRRPLTHWLPAREEDCWDLTLRYTILRETYFQKLVNAMQRVKLASMATQVSLELAVAAKASEIVGQVLSFLLREGQAETVFELACSFSLRELNEPGRGAGFYLILGSKDDRPWPKPSDLTWRDQQLRGPRHLLDKLCLAGLQVSASPVRGSEAARQEGWWQLLYTAVDEVKAMPVRNRKERELAQDTWRRLLQQVKALARKQNHWLLSEIEAMVTQADLQVQPHLMGGVQRETTAAALPQEWQDLLGVRTMTEETSQAQQYEQQVSTLQEWMKRFD